MKKVKKTVMKYQDGGVPKQSVPEKKAEFLRKNDSIQKAKKAAPPKKAQNGSAIGAQEVNLTKAKNGKAMKGKCKNGCK